jgi:cell division protein FtsB
MQIINSQKNKKINFILLSLLTVIITVLLARYVSELLFEGRNSFKVYSKLKQQKEQLQYNITKLQFSNARLQKEYFELKNLEPEE